MAQPNLKNRIVYSEQTTALVRLTEAELEGDYPNWFSDAEVNQFNSHWAFPKSKSEVASFVHNLANDRRQLVFAIYDLVSNRHIGNISLQAIDWQNRNGELAFLLGDKSQWGKGHGQRAGALVIQHGFQVLNLHRLYLGCLSNNLAMQRLAEKLGFKAEGVRKQAVFNQNQYVDVCEYGLLKADAHENAATGGS